jgi:glycosyltransferase involved in cell wall biosynthesis
LRVDVIGEGPERRRLELEAARLGIAERTRFHGFLDCPRRDDLVGAARVAVMPSNLEGFGLTALEAASLGTPVVASDAPGLRDAVRNGRTGLLARTGDDADFANRIGWLLDDDGMAERMSGEARSWSREFNWNESASEIGASIDALVAA